MARPSTIERGDIYFLYRPKVETEEVDDRGDVQRFYMILASKKPRKSYRMFMLGRKKLPRTNGRGQHPERRNWALNVLTTRDPADIRRELQAFTYGTKTRGERFVPSATPLGEGRYELVRHKDHTEIIYALELPEEAGPAQEEFEVEEEASLIVSVKNPDISADGLPQPQEPPGYPAELKKKFGDRRWIDADDPALLDYENAQLLLLGARSGDVQEELGVDIDEEEERLCTSDICRELRAGEELEPIEPLMSGKLPESEIARGDGHVVREEDGWRTRAGERGGAAALRKGPSAAALTRMLEGIDFPSAKEDLVEHAKKHRDRVDEPDEALEVLKQLPGRKYRGMKEVTKALGEIR